MTQQADRKMVNLRIKPDLWQQVRIAAVTQNISTREFVERALEIAVKKAK